MYLSLSDTGTGSGRHDAIKLQEEKGPMTAIYKDTWFDARHAGLVRACLAQIRMKASFEIRVPVGDADRVRAAIGALSPTGPVRTLGWWAMRAGVCGIYFRNRRFANLLWVIGRARRAAFKVFLFDQQDGLRVVFESTR